MLTGETVSQLRVIGPAEPTPTAATRTSWRSAASSCCSTMPASDLKWASGPDVLVDEHDGAVEQLAAHRHQPDGELGAADVDRQDDERQLARAAIGAVVGVVGAPAGRRAVVAATAIRSYPNDFSGKLGFAHGGGHGARTGAVVVSDAAWVHVPTYGDRSFVAGAAAAVALQRHDADDRVPHRPGGRRRAAAGPADPGGRRPGRRRRHLGRLAELQRHVRGAARPGAVAVPGDVRRRALRVPGRDVQPLRLHLGRQGLRHGPRPPPGLPEEARRAVRHPARHRRASPGRGSSRAGASAPRARRTGGG